MPMALVPVTAGTPVSNTVVWPYWNQAYATTTATTTNIVVSNTTTSATWQAWNQLTNAGTTVIQPATVTPIYVYTSWSAWNTGYEETAEARQAREHAQAEATLRREQAAAERVAAKERALELLGHVLTPDQMASYRDHGYFEVRSSTGRRWRIRDRGQSGNVDLMPEIGDERDATYCAHPPGGLPDPDAHLAQVLTLVTDEAAFMRVANCHYQRPGRAA